MKILILEDDLIKLEKISNLINKTDKNVSIDNVDNYGDFHKKILITEYDLILMDLLVPSFSKGEPKDLSEELMNAVRDSDTKNSKTSVIALTKFQDKAQIHSNNLNIKDIRVVTFTDGNEWHEPIVRFIGNFMSIPHYNFVIVCALDIEALGFRKANCIVSSNKPIRGLDCSEININGSTGVIVTCPRMGLVDAAITSARAIELFQPSLICMSGICAGVKDEVEIYDLIIPSTCYQHDSGKWAVNGLVSEPYSVQLDNQVVLELKSIINTEGFVGDLLADIKPKRSQIPDELEEIKPKIILGVASSGSTVIADTTMNKNVEQQHRKIISFDMENYAIYESARLASTQPIFFSIKSVVDNGTVLKGDNFQDLACELAAKATVKILSSIL